MHTAMDEGSPRAISVDRRVERPLKREPRRRIRPRSSLRLRTGCVSGLVSNVTTPIRHSCGEQMSYEC